ncbi:MAG: hypothetical protein AMJ91_04545 [candidate division Zixibacteria bacterium SM23_73_3]|nr:MAG: hypothetical protein AMJ91_04545 [candidate division Zixibacteria bacterium SM23_73_3]
MTSDEDKIYKDLTYTQHSYFCGEQIFPYWENIFAVIIAGFFITYFSIEEDKLIEKTLLCVIGFIFSLGWFCLVSRNYLFSKCRGDRLRELQQALKQSVATDKGTEKKIALFCEGEYVSCCTEKEKKWFNKTDSWTIRKLLPMSLSIIWVFLLVYSIVSLCINGAATSHYGRVTLVNL